MTKLYNVITNNNNGVPFPDTQAIDSSGPLATDGTEIVKEVVDDMWLEKQALLDFYNYPPIGIEDSAGISGFAGLPISQPLAIQYMNYATPGTIVNWASELDPVVVSAALANDMEIRLLLLHGQGILRAAYKMLDLIVYVGDLSNAAADSFYHADDALGAVRNPTGDWLILPDIRGRSFRALDPSGLIDPDGAGRIVGSNQEDAFQDFGASPAFYTQRSGPPDQRDLFYTHDSGQNPLASPFSVVGTDSVSDFNNKVDTTVGSNQVTQIDFAASGDPNARTSIETRNKNIATEFAIHY